MTDLERRLRMLLAERGDRPAEVCTAPSFDQAELAGVLVRFAKTAPALTRLLLSGHQVDAALWHQLADIATDLGARCRREAAAPVGPVIDMVEEAP